MLFIEYPKCSTCKKAKEYLEKNNIEFKDRNIVTETPTKEELKEWLKRYNISTNFNDYYMSIDNMLEMKESGMEFGCHTSTHKRLSSLNEKKQYQEIRENMQLLYKNNLLTQQDILSIAYPFGNYNNSTIEILNNLKFDFAFNTKEEEIYKINKYELPRFDCNRLKE